MAKRVEEIYDDDFALALDEHEFVFVDFYADWCGPCRAIAPVVERVAREYDGRIRFARLNTDGNPLTARRYGVRSIPTLILFHGGQPVIRLDGFQPEERLRTVLDHHAPAPAPREEQPPASRGWLSRLIGPRG
jgi:thioredoxin 1